MGGICKAPVLRATQSPSVPLSSTGSGNEVGGGEGEGRGGGFNYRASMDNLVIRNFQFPVR